VLVSVYLPTKDRLELLEAAIASVLAQTHPFVELIVVNDGSRDGTGDYLDALACSDQRVRVIHHDQTVGAPRSRNEAIRVAHGEWITGLDDDDTFAPHRIEALLQFALLLEKSATSYSVVFSQYHTLRGGKKTATSKRGNVGLEDIFERNQVGNQFLARRELFFGVGLFDENLGAWQDLDMAMRMISARGPARLLDAPLYNVCDEDRPDRISRKPKAAIVEAYWRVVAKWPKATAHARRALYLQVLGAHYDFPIEWRDVKTYVGLGVTPRSLLELARVGWRRNFRGVT